MRAESAGRYRREVRRRYPFSSRDLQIVLRFKNSLSWRECQGAEGFRDGEVPPKRSSGHS